VLPLAISFFTFQQIAYLVDVAKGVRAERSLLRYGVFVSFFPQLIAGPIVQFRDIRAFLEHAHAPALALGLSLFTVGLAKKVLLADTLAPHVRSAFGSAYLGSVDIWTAWTGLIAYTLQIYYDFSGYSDMALGLGLMFGLRLPINFFSPYKAGNIADFWRRWHMTLSSFLRHYLYIPLGGSRGSGWRTARNLGLTMLLGGLWHGANWTFVVWGAWHGLLLILHRFSGWIRVPAMLASLFTLACVMFGWLIFRSPDLESAAVMAMALVTPAPMPPHYLDLSTQWQLYAALALGILIARRAPNSAQIFLNARLASHDEATTLRWQPGLGWMLATAFLLALSIACLSRETEFLYFQF
jgi:D-alanyl-lipoteichoic acid acyltransferase DltB (MBOAT superfamily)